MLAASSTQRSEDDPDRYFLSDIQDDLYAHTDHRFDYQSNSFGNSGKRKFPKPSTGIELE